MPYIKISLYATYKLRIYNAWKTIKRMSLTNEDVGMYMVITPENLQQKKKKNNLYTFKIENPLAFGLRPICIKESYQCGNISFQLPASLEHIKGTN